MLTPGITPPAEHLGRLLGRRQLGRLAEHQRPAVGLPEVAEGREHAHDLAPVLHQPRLAGRHPPAGAHDLGAHLGGADGAGPQEVRRGHQRVGERQVGLQRVQAGSEHVAAVGGAADRRPAVGQRRRVDVLARRRDRGVGVEDMVGHGRHRPPRVAGAGKHGNYPPGKRPRAASVRSGRIKVARAASACGLPADHPMSETASRNTLADGPRRGVAPHAADLRGGAGRHRRHAGDGGLRAARGGPGAPGPGGHGAHAHARRRHRLAHLAHAGHAEDRADGRRRLGGPGLVQAVDGEPCAACERSACRAAAPRPSSGASARPTARECRHCSPPGATPRWAGASRSAVSLPPCAASTLPSRASPRSRTASRARHSSARGSGGSVR